MPSHTFLDDGSIRIDFSENNTSITLPATNGFNLNPSSSDWHEYTVIAKISSSISYGDVITGRITTEDMQLALLQQAAPEWQDFTLQDLTHNTPIVATGSVTDTFGPGKVVHQVSQDGLVVVNQTLPGHPFHPGYVVRTVVENGGNFEIVTYGIGNTSFDGLVGDTLTIVNVVAGEVLFSDSSTLYNQAVVNLEVRNEREKENIKCFSAGTLIDMADGSQKPIEEIKVGDEVMAYDPTKDAGQGTLKAARVSQTMVNQVDELIDFHGVKMTPGHATLVGEGPHKGKHVPLMDILISDGAIVNRDGVLIRASTNLPVGSEGDQFVKVAYILDRSQQTYHEGQMRVGTLMVGENGRPDWRVMDAIAREGYVLHAGGLIAKDGEAPHPLYWFGPIPKPEDYVLTKSRLTISDLYTARDIGEGSAIGADLPRHGGMTVQ